MKTCNEINEKLIQFVDGELEPAEMAAVGSHLTACEKCRKEVDELNMSLAAMKNFLEAESGMFGGADISSNVMAEIRREAYEKKHAAKLSYKYFAFAAAVAMIFFSVFSITRLQERHFTTSNAAQPHLEVSVNPEGLEIKDDVGGDIRMVSVRQ